MTTKKCRICGRLALLEMHQLFKLKGKQKFLNEDERNYLEICHKCKLNINYDRVVEIIAKDEKWLMWSKDLARMSGCDGFLEALEKYQSAS